MKFQPKERGVSALGTATLLYGLLFAGIGRAQATADTVFRAAQAAAARGDRAEAARQFEHAAELYGQLESQASAQHRALPAGTRQRHAFALSAIGRSGEAITEMKAASNADPKNPTLHNDLGSLYAQGGQWPQAESEFAAAARLAPLNAEAHLRLALAMKAQEEPGAMTEMERAAKLDPRSEAIATQYAAALTASGDDAQAIPVLQRLVAAHPSNQAAIYELALALQRSDQPGRAIPLFEQLRKAQPGNAAVATNLGMALTQERRAKDAVPVLQTAVRLAPGDVTALEDLAAAYLQLNQFEDAVAQLQAALRIAPDMPQLHYNLGLAYKMQDDVSRAEPELKRAEQLDPGAPEAPLALGMLYMQAARYEDAGRELKASLTMRPQNGDAWATLGSVDNKLDRLPEAEAALREAIKQLPDQADPHLTLAAVYVKEKKVSEAAQQRTEAADLMRNNMNRQRAEVATHSGEALLKRGDLAGAATQFQDAIGFAADYAEAHNGLAKVYSAQGKREEAAAERAKAAAAARP